MKYESEELPENNLFVRIVGWKEGLRGSLIAKGLSSYIQACGLNCGCMRRCQ